ARLNDAPDDPEDEGFACQRQEWLAREAAGAQPRRNDAEDGHGGTYKIRAVASSPGPKRLSRCGLDPLHRGVCDAQEVLEQLLPVVRADRLRMELHAVDRVPAVLHRHD